MKHLLYYTCLTFFLFILNLPIIAQTNPNHVYVKGYTRKDGTYVRGHYRTAPNSTNRDNFSTRGNYNPYTGKAGWIEPDNKPNPYESKVSSGQTQVLESPSYQTQTYKEKPDSYVNVSSGIHEVYTCSSLLAQPNLTAKEVDKLCDGKVYVIEKYNSQYYKVTNGSSIGYLPLSSFKSISKPDQSKKTLTYTYSSSKVQPTISSTQLSPGTYDVYTCAIIYDQPNQSTAQEVGRACDGSVYLIKKVNDKYYRVKYGSLMGYIHYNSLK